MMSSFSSYASFRQFFNVLFIFHFHGKRELLLQDQLRQAKNSVVNMQKLHEFAQSQLFEVRAQSGTMLHFFQEFI